MTFRGVSPKALEARLRRGASEGHILGQQASSDTLFITTTAN